MSGAGRTKRQKAGNWFKVLLNKGLREDRQGLNWLDCATNPESLGPRQTSWDSARDGF